MTEITQADRIAASALKDLNIIQPKDEQVVASYFSIHRQYGYDQGYYDGRQLDGAEERAAIVAYARGHGGNAWSRDVLYFADKIEAGEHLK